ncbi:MAG TPA: SRPBCC family protein [Nocardioides sp.]|jgi:uncharacterized protein YndB with AHSA1/START domain
MTQTDIVGTVREHEGAAVVHMEARYPTDISDLWSAITEPERLARWIAEVSGDLRVGGSFSATFTSTWSGTGQVVVCQPPHRLLVATDGGDGDIGEIEATLTEDGDHTLLVVEQRGIALSQGPLYGAGWEVHLEDLALHVAGEPAGDWRARWAELSPAYLARGLDVG